MKHTVWRHTIRQLLLSWLVICLAPAVVLWYEYIAEDRVEIPQINSFIIVTLGIIICQAILSKISAFPGQRPLLIVLPILLAVATSMGVFILVFHLTYTVYFLVAAFVIGVVFFFCSQLYQQAERKLCIAYIPLGRLRDFVAVGGETWYALPMPQLDLPNVQAIVADLASSEIDDTWQRFLAQQTIAGMPVYNYLQIVESLTGRSPIYYLYENDLGALQPSPIYLFVKRMMDIALVLLSLPITLPIMLCTWLAIRLDSTGKAIFSQTRIGQGGKPFVMYKFRSMYAHAPAQNQQMTQANDARITRVGRVIRKLRIDELPQFYNVLKGDMSLIGPRPELPNMVTKLEQEIPFYIYRQIVKPGISGWAQVMQGDGHVEDIQTKLEYDFYYIKNFSFTLDFLIVVKTVQTMLTGFGAR